MAFPSTLSTFTNPLPTDRLNSPSHSSIESAQNTALLEIQRAVGTDASTIGTIIGDLRNANSPGGGHVQTANKGGTGQTSYAKGDLLVAQSASALSKLAVGQDTFVLQADSSTNTGIKWAAKTSPKVVINPSVLTISNTNSETSVMSATIPGSVLGTNNAVRATVYISNLAIDSGAGVTIRANYGTSSIGSFQFTRAGNINSVKGKIEITVFANNAANSQKGIISTKMTRDRLNPETPSVWGVDTFTVGTVVEDSNAPKNIGLTATFSDASTGNILLSQGYIVEQIN